VSHSQAAPTGAMPFFFSVAAPLLEFLPSSRCGAAVRRNLPHPILSFAFTAFAPRRGAARSAGGSFLHFFSYSNSQFKFKGRKALQPQRVPAQHVDKKVVLSDKKVVLSDKKVVLRGQKSGVFFRQILDICL